MAGNAVVDNNGVAVFAVVCFVNRFGLVCSVAEMEVRVEFTGRSIPVFGAQISVLLDVQVAVYDVVGVSTYLERRVPVAKVGEGGLNGFTSRRRTPRAGGLVADGDGAGGGSIVDELLLGGGGLLLHHDMYHLSVLVCSPVGAFYCSTNTARLSTRVDKSAVVRVTLDVGARRAVACNQKQYRFSGHLLRGG